MIYNRSKSPSNNSTTSTTPTNSAKQKTTASGSLTSTPSKIAKSVSDSSDLNSVSTSQSSISTSATFNNQDSFISSIPERANDSTLVGNHHHNNSNTNLSNINANTNEANTENHSVSNLSKKIRATNTTDLNMQEIKSKTGPTNISKTPTISQESTSISSTSNSILPPNNITPTLSMSNTNSLPANQMFASMFSNSSGNSSNQQNNDMVPIALFPLSAVQQMIFQQKLYHDLHATSNKSQIDASSLSRQSMESNLSNKLWVNTGFSNLTSSSSVHAMNGMMGVNGVLSEMSSPLSSTSIIAPHNKFDIPQVELDSSEISFGAIAEGCSDFRRVFFKLNNPNSNG
jgi:hypothetical protein